MFLRNSSTYILILKVTMTTTLTRHAIPRPYIWLSKTLGAVRHASTLPLTVKSSSQELAAGRLGERNLEKAIRSLHEDGLVVIPDVIPHEHLDSLNSNMVKDARTLQARGKHSPFNYYNVGNLQQDAPPVKAHFHQSIFLIPIATQLTTGVLGPKPKWTFCSGNSAMPPTPGAQPQRQPVHTDADLRIPRIRSHR